MENLVDFYKGKKVFVTGHTGFKGSWLTYWLKILGAEVVGYALSPHTKPSHFELLKLDIESHLENICDFDTLQKTLKRSEPDIIFHLAAQPLVRYSYQNPVETFQTNVMGTVNLLEAARNCPSLKAIVVVTTDKCYENLEQEIGYIETDRMGGYDPYSNSKGCAELVVSSYRNSFFNLNEFQKKHSVLLSTARAGNVIGGGDWSEDRLLPDIIKGAVEGRKTLIRYPKSTRPWQHVLEPLSGYLMLGVRLLNGEKEFAEAWNFGPEENNSLSVENVLEIANSIWDKISFEIDTNNNHYHEAGLLSLNIDKAKNKLGWKPKWSNLTSITNTIEWYKEFYSNQSIITNHQISTFLK